MDRIGDVMMQTRKTPGSAVSVDEKVPELLCSASPMVQAREIDRVQPEHAARDEPVIRFFGSSA